MSASEANSPISATPSDCIVVTAAVAFMLHLAKKSATCSYAQVTSQTLHLGRDPRNGITEDAAVPAKVVGHLSQVSWGNAVIFNTADGQGLAVRKQHVKTVSATHCTACVEWFLSAFRGMERESALRRRHYTHLRHVVKINTAAVLCAGPDCAGNACKCGRHNITDSLNGRKG